MPSFLAGITGEINNKSNRHRLGGSVLAWAEQGASAAQQCWLLLATGRCGLSGAAHVAAQPALKQQVRGSAGAAAAAPLREPQPISAACLCTVCANRGREGPPFLPIAVPQLVPLPFSHPLHPTHLHASQGRAGVGTEPAAPGECCHGLRVTAPTTLQPVQVHKFSFALYRLIFEHLPDTSSLYCN